MTDSPRPGYGYQGPGSPYDGPTEQFPNGYPAYSGYPEPAYQSPTQHLPNDWAYATQAGAGQPPPPPEPPRSPRSPKWLWFLAGAAVVLVIALVGALILTNGTGSTDTDTEASSLTATEPTQAPSSSPSRTTTAPTTPSTTSSAPTTTRTTTPLVPPTETTSSGVTETVLYQVTGEGRALNITYVDTGNVMQTEFNTTLPWSKEVTLESPASDAASVVIVNVGREIECSVTVDGVVVATNTGSGLTVCSR